MGFLIPRGLTPFLKGIKSLFITFYLYLRSLVHVYKCTEKHFININKIISEIRKVKSIEEENVLTNSKKAIARNST